MDNNLYPSLETQATDKILTNSTVIDDLEKFLTLTQDDKQFAIKSMDQAFYLGLSIRFIETIQNPPQTLVGDVEELKLRVLTYINNVRNTNGGYGNWRGAKSSAESTVQAIDVYNALGFPQNFTSKQANETIGFMNTLKTNLGGFYPLQDWDAPDITSTYRAVYIQNLLNKQFNVKAINKTGIKQFVQNNYITPFFISGASGYSEVKGGKPEVLASLDALETFLGLNQTDPYRSSVIRFINSLTSPNGGVAGFEGKLPKTGYTSAAIQYYLRIKNYFPGNLSEFNLGFLDRAIDYLLGNRAPDSGFTAADTDSTPELSSTYFVLRSIYELKQNNLWNRSVDLTGVYSFLLSGHEPTYGLGEYPGDIAELSYTSRAVLLGRLINRTDWMSPKLIDYILKSFDEKNSGFGYRPGGTARIKYTYYALAALRALHHPFSNIDLIVDFILSAQTPDGGFGQISKAKISYISHTFWAISALKSLGQLTTLTLDFAQIYNWLQGLRDPVTGMYKNSITSQPSILSTYRAIQIMTYLGYSVDSTDTVHQSIHQYQTTSGGFVNDLTKTLATMEATYFAVRTMRLLNTTYNESKVYKYVRGLLNSDGAFALREGFSSRVSSSFYAVSLLRKIEGVSKDLSPIEGGLPDLFAPIIEPAFVANLRKQNKISGSFSLTAQVKDPEGNVSGSWIEAKWQRYSDNQTFSYRESGTNLGRDQWEFTVGPFNQTGVLLFRLIATDLNNNTATTSWLALDTTGIPVGGGVFASINWERIILNVLPYLMLFFALIEMFYERSKKKEILNEKVKMVYQPKNQEGDINFEMFSALLVILAMVVLSFVARIYIQDALIIIQKSIFLFRFLLAVVVIIITKYVLGLDTYGLFAPSVLVIAMLQVGPFWGSVIFFNVFGLLYIIRSLMEPLNFPVGFRIGIMMVFNVAFLGVLELIGEVYRIPFLAQALFVPIIIMPWIADRYISNARQFDQLFAFTRLIISLLITLLAYVFMSNSALVTFVAVNPETWVVLIAFLVFFGKYRKYTILDKRRFYRLFRIKNTPMSMMIRNRNYIAQYNPPIIHPLINKYDMKGLFDKWGVATAELLAVVDNVDQLDPLFKRLSTEVVFKNGFVIKPSQSYGGMGIVVVQEVTPEGNFRVGSDIYHPDALKEECKRIIQGEYLTAHTTSENDIIVIEEKINLADSMKSISIGLPDIRVIVFRGIPVMAMARLPTKESDGKANLKQGAIGAGIHLSSGLIFRAEWKTNPLNIHPDTGNEIIGYQFTKWDEILAVACLAQKSTGLGYAGVDLVLGQKNGEEKIYVLEINKRPGLEIQNINLASLMERLDYIEDNDLDMTDKSPTAVVRYVKQLSKEYWEV